jgi:hypothetical protein
VLEEERPEGTAPAGPSTPSNWLLEVKEVNHQELLEEAEQAA